MKLKELPFLLFVLLISISTFSQTWNYNDRISLFIETKSKKFTLIGFLKLKRPRQKPRFLRRDAHGAGRAVGHRAVDQGRPVRLPAGDAEGGGRRRSSGRLQRCRGLCTGHRQRPVPDPPLGRRCGRAHRHAAALEERRHARAVRRPRLAL